MMSLLYMQSAKYQINAQSSEYLFPSISPGKNHCNTTVNKFTTTQFQMYGSGGVCEW